jgi:Tol biopolymer transport system component
MKSRTNSMYRFGLFIIPLAALVVYMVTSAGPAYASFPGTNGKIAFTQGDQNGIAPTNIITANPDGSEQKQLPLPDGIGVEFFSQAVWSSDGSKLLISHTFRLDNTGQCCLPFRPAIVNSDGSEFTQLTITYGPFDMDCEAWSVDQTRLLCAFGDQFAGVFSIRTSDGGDPVRLTTNPYGSEDLATDVSPDGTRFVFVRRKPGASPPPNPDRTQKVALFVENIDGTGLRQITPFGLALPHEFSSANWSPDGREIIAALSNGRLFIVHPDGTGLKPIPLQTGTGKYFAVQPHFSPDGTRIIFCMFINGGEGVYTANPDGSGVVQVTFTTNPAAIYNGPDWGRQPPQ